MLTNAFLPQLQKLAAQHSPTLLELLRRKTKAIPLKRQLTRTICGAPSQ